MPAVNMTEERKNEGQALTGEYSLMDQDDSIKQVSIDETETLSNAQSQLEQLKKRNKKKHYKSIKEIRRDFKDQIRWEPAYHFLGTQDERSALK